MILDYGEDQFLRRCTAAGCSNPIGICNIPQTQMIESLFNTSAKFSSDIVGMKNALVKDGGLMSSMDILLDVAPMIHLESDILKKEKLLLMGEC